MMGVWSIRWSHFFGEAGRSWYATVGPGRAVFGACCDIADGFGFVVGGGREFRKHFIAELNFSMGRSTSDKRSITQTSLNLSIAVLAY
jgi:hypothetical protein